jgi:hypothetical protein
MSKTLEEEIVEDINKRLSSVDDKKQIRLLESLLAKHIADKPDYSVEEAIRTLQVLVMAFSLHA